MHNPIELSVTLDCWKFNFGDGNLCKDQIKYIKIYLQQLCKYFSVKNFAWTHVCKYLNWTKICLKNAKHMKS